MTVQVRNPLQQIPNLLSNIRWALNFAWQTSKKIFLGLIISQVISAFMPAIQALGSRNAINELVAGVEESGSSTNLFFLWLGISLVALIVQRSIAGISTYLDKRLKDEANIDVTIRILDHSTHLDYQYFEDPRFQDVLGRASGGMGHYLSQFITLTITSVTSGIQLISVVGLMVVIEPLVLVVLFVLLLPYGFSYWRLAVAQYSKEYNRATKRRWAGYFISFFTSRSLVAETKLLELTPLLKEKFWVLMSDFRDQDRALHLRELIILVVFNLTAILLFFLVIARVAISTFNGNLTVGDFTLFLGAAAYSQTTLSRIIASLSKVMERALYITDLRDFFAIGQNLSFNPAEDTEDKKPPVSNLNLNGQITFKNVTFAYPGNTQPTLENMSFQIEAGETIALVGANGAGKSTLAKLLSRLYEPTEGQILVDDIDIQDIPLQDYYRQMSFLLQTYNRYEATVNHNIMYGNWREIMDKPEIVQKIVQDLGMEDMILELPNGYETQLGRRFGDFDLSGGQWQKISIARIFTRNTPILIVDEPTASLDAQSEYRLFLRFKELTEGRTTIIISHRFSTVRVADRIMVLKDGAIIENGSHDQLMAAAGHYAQLYSLQQQQMMRKAINLGTLS